MKLIFLLVLLTLYAPLSAASEGWTAKPENLKKVGKEWGLGYVKKPFKGHVVKLGLVEPPPKWDLEMFPHEHTPTMNQGNCGSCVVFAFDYVFEEGMRLRGLKFPPLSQQHLMNCGSGGQCNGAYGEEIAEDVVRLKTLHTLADYPYTASSGSCKTKTGQRYGQVVGYQTIDGSVRSIAQAIATGHPVAVGIAAGGSFGSYSSGIYSACNASSINHYVVIVGYDLEGGKFDANGNLPAGVGTFLVQNSWGNGFGDKGRILMKITDKQGRRCHGIARDKGDAQILDYGIPMPGADKPVAFSLESKDAKLDAIWKPNTMYTVDDAKKALKNALDAVGK